jgi:hypothetical protein
MYAPLVVKVEVRIPCADSALNLDHLEPSIKREPQLPPRLLFPSGKTNFHHAASAPITPLATIASLIVPQAYNANTIHSLSMMNALVSKTHAAAHFN